MLKISFAYKGSQEAISLGRQPGGAGGGSLRGCPALAKLAWPPGPLVVGGLGGHARGANAKLSLYTICGGISRRTVVAVDPWCLVHCTRLQSDKSLKKDYIFRDKFEISHFCK